MVYKPNEKNRKHFPKQLEIDEIIFFFLSPTPSKLPQQSKIGHFYFHLQCFLFF